jgi:DNA helicase TIP49 (TBP-interacting protein)
LRIGKTKKCTRRSDRIDRKRRKIPCRVPRATEGLLVTLFVAQNTKGYQNTQVGSHHAMTFTKEGVTGDVIYIESNSGAVKRVEDRIRSRRNLIWRRKNTCRCPRAMCTRSGKWQDVTLHDLDMLPMPHRVPACSGGGKDVMSLMAAMGKPKDGITDKLRQKSTRWSPSTLIRRGRTRSRIVY